MAEKQRRSTGRSRKKSPGNSQCSDLNTEDAAQRRAALEVAVRCKIESEKRALQIVYRLLEDHVTEEFFTDCGRFINPAHYKDAVDERFIIRSCGYPICIKKLENVPKQKYQISTKTNKVYDITERKCFCSNFCFRASKYYEAQIPKSPVWMREHESVQSGIEVKLNEKRIKTSDVEEPTFTEKSDSSSPDSDSDVSKEPEQEFVSSIVSGNRPSPEGLQTQGQKIGEAKTPVVGDQNQTLTETTERLCHSKLTDHERTLPFDSQNEALGPSTKDHPAEETEISKSTDSSNVEALEVTERAVSKGGAEQLRQILHNSKQYYSALKNPVRYAAAKGSMLETLSQTLNEWKTEETLKYLYGSNYKIEFPFQNSSALGHQVEDLDEDDLILETNDLENAFEIPRAENTSLNESLPFYGLNDAMKPAPDYKKLKEETEMLNSRIEEFFRGNYMLPKELEQTHNQSKQSHKNEVSIGL
ncbi:hypothetical protein FKM82_001775 [Ascaphus truei]